MDNFCSLLKQLRIEKGLSQTELGKLLNTTQDTISLWELNKSYPKFEEIKTICKLFEVSADYLLGLTDEY